MTNGNLTTEEYAFLRRKQAEIEARKSFEARKPPQSVQGWKSAKEFNLPDLLAKVPKKEIA